MFFAPSNRAPCFLDNIESNMSSIAVDTSRASEELTTAAEYQRRAGKRAACLMIILVIVVAIVLLAVGQIPCLRCARTDPCSRFSHSYEIYLLLLLLDNFMIHAAIFMFIQ